MTFYVSYSGSKYDGISHDKQNDASLDESAIYLTHPDYGRVSLEILCGILQVIPPNVEKLTTNESVREVIHQFILTIINKLRRGFSSNRETIDTMHSPKLRHMSEEVMKRFFVDKKKKQQITKRLVERAIGEFQNCDFEGKTLSVVSNKILKMSLHFNEIEDGEESMEKIRLLILELATESKISLSKDGTRFGMIVPNDIIKKVPREIDDEFVSNVWRDFGDELVKRVTFESAVEVLNESNWLLVEYEQERRNRLMRWMTSKFVLGGLL